MKPLTTTKAKVPLNLASPSPDPLQTADSDCRWSPALAGGRAPSLPATVATHKAADDTEFTSDPKVLAGESAASVGPVTIAVSEAAGHHPPASSSMIPSAGQLGPLTPAPGTLAPPLAPLPNPLERAVASQVSRALVRPLAQIASDIQDRRETSSHPNERTLVIRLTPAELGTVRIELHISDRGVAVRLHAEDAAVRTALERALPAMRAEASNRDSPVISVDLTRQGNDAAGDGRAFQGHHHHGEEDRTGNQPSHRRRGDRSVFRIDHEDDPVPGLLPALGARPSADLISATQVDAAV